MDGYFLLSIFPGNKLMFFPIQIEKRKKKTILEVRKASFYSLLPYTAIAIYSYIVIESYGQHGIFLMDTLHIGMLEAVKFTGATQRVHTVYISIKKKFDFIVSDDIFGVHFMHGARSIY